MPGNAIATSKKAKQQNNLQGSKLFSLLSWKLANYRLTKLLRPLEGLAPSMRIEINNVLHCFFVRSPLSFDANGLRVNPKMRPMGE